MVDERPVEEVRAEEERRRQRELYLCTISFYHFVKCYCHLLEVSTPDNPGGDKAYTMWPHLAKTIQVFEQERLVVILKSRQIGLSWLLAAYALWFAMFRKASNVMLFSKGETEAWELLDKCKSIHRFLPLWMQQETSGNTELMRFPDVDSTIRAFPATKTAGVSFTGSLMIFDEWDWHPYAVDNYNQAKPAIDTGGAQLIGCFTVDKTKPDSLPKKIFRDAMEKKNDFTWLFFPFNVRPGRDEAWYDYTKRNTPANLLEGQSPELYMEQNYPRSIEEALRSPQTIAACRQDVLDSMASDCRNPLTVTFEGVDSAICHVYQEFQIGKTYVAASDTSHGVGQDYNCTTILDCRTGAVVADILNNLLSPEELAYHTVKLLELFKSPVWWPEVNDWGRSTLNEAQRLGYRNIGFQDKERNKPGFHTNEATRRDLFSALLPAVNNRQLVIFNKDGLRQFYDLIRNAKEGGRIEALAGRHDDYPICLGICCLKMKDVELAQPKYEPIHSLTFRQNTGLVTPDGKSVSTLTFLHPSIDWKFGRAR